MVYQLLWDVAGDWTNFYLLSETFTNFDGRVCWLSLRCQKSLLTLAERQTSILTFGVGRQDLLTIVIRLRLYWLSSGGWRQLLTFDFNVLQEGVPTFTLRMLGGIYQLLILVSIMWDWYLASKFLLTFTNFSSFRTSNDSKYRLLIWQKVCSNLLTSDFSRLEDAESAL